MSANTPSFVVYIDEAGDEGFKFPIKFGDKGSSLWFTMSAVVFKTDNELRQTKVVGTARDALGYHYKRPIHFSDLRHEAKLIVARHVATAARTCPSLKAKKVTPHTLRHAAAMALLRRGVDLTVIALWLGHESTETTQVYQL